MEIIVQSPTSFTVRSASILAENLLLFGQILGAMISYHFDEADLVAIEYGASNPSGSHQGWTVYPFLGGSTLNTEFRYDDFRHRMHVRINPESAYDDEVYGLCDVLDAYDYRAEDIGLTELLRRAFPEENTPLSDGLLSTSPEHISQCEECQHALHTFGGKSWLALDQNTLPWGWGDIGLMTNESARYFLPAYVLFSIYTSRMDILESVERHLVGGIASLHPLQRMVMTVVKYHIPRTNLETMY